MHVVLDVRGWCNLESDSSCPPSEQEYDLTLEDDASADDNVIKVLAGETLRWALEDGSVVFFHTDVEVAKS